MSTIYKILFEVRLLHEFYCTNYDGAVVFDLPAPGRTAFLQDRFARNERNIGADLDWKIPGEATGLYNNHRLRLLKTYSGFKVAIAVKPVALPGSLTGFIPVAPLPEAFSLPVLMMRKGKDIDLVTGSRMVSQLSAAYYFTNENLQGGRTFPWLAEAIAPFNGAYPYEQGELARFGASTIRSFYTDETDTAQWLTLPAGGYVGETDRMLLKPDFYYTFRKEDNVNDASFVLKDSTNAVIETVNARTATGVFTRRPVSFDLRKLRTLPETTPGNDLLYTLEVTGNGGFNRKHKVVFLRDLETNIRDVWGAVQVKNRVTNAAFQLTEPGNNRIITRLNADRTVNTPHPVFELWIRSRVPFWRYINDKGKDIKNGLFPEFLLDNSGKPFTKIPRVLSYTPVLFRKADTTLDYLPNPKLFAELKKEGARVFADIMVPESDMFPLGP